MKTKADLDQEYTQSCAIIGDVTHKIQLLRIELDKQLLHISALQNELASLTPPTTKEETNG